jgi:hypothetical protein
VTVVVVVNLRLEIHSICQQLEMRGWKRLVEELGVGEYGENKKLKDG